MPSRPTLWDAVLRRDAGADGLFVYAVRSTHIYCRPSCPSRRPRRERVEFFANPAAAVRHGYRPCRRCRPDEPGVPSSGAVSIQAACEAIARAPERRWTTAEIMRIAGGSASQVRRAFRRALGLAPREFVAACRRRRLLATLRAGEPVTDAVYAAGYGSPSRVYDGARRWGLTPATYGRGGRGARIAWFTTSSSIGRILVAATDRGVCGVQIGETDEALLVALRREFPCATIAGTPARRLRPIAAVARAAADAQFISPAFSVDVRATAFQWRVWRALMRIPPGQTRSYGAIAREIGAPGAARAVARACASNRLALVVPCHRVVGADGNLRGYRWGTDVKRALLSKEGG